jgi:hypothetical protein
MAHFFCSQPGKKTGLSAASPRICHSKSAPPGGNPAQLPVAMARHSKRVAAVTETVFAVQKTARAKSRSDFAGLAFTVLC